MPHYYWQLFVTGSLVKKELFWRTQKMARKIRMIKIVKITLS